MATSFRPLRHRSFAILWTCGFISNIGTWMEAVALGYYVTHRTHQASWAAIIAAAGFVPMAVIGPLGGVLADRGSRRRTFFITTMSLTALATTIAVLTAVGDPHPGVVALVALGDGICAALGFPAYQAMIPDLVPPEDLVGAIGLGSAQYNLGRIIGPAVAGIVVSTAGVSAALFANAVSFLAVLFALTVITLPERVRVSSHISIRDSIAAGVRYVKSEPGLRATFTVMMLFTFLASPFIALLPAMAVKELHGGAATTAILVTSQGVGAVAAALSLNDFVQRFGSRRVLVGAVRMVALALLLYGLAPGTALKALALVMLGAAYMAGLNSFTSIASTPAPDVLRGRVLSLNMMLLGSLYPLGSLIQGRVADSVGLAAVTATAAVLLGTAFTAMLLLRPAATGALDRPVDPAALRPSAPTSQAPDPEQSSESAPAT